MSLSLEPMLQIVPIMASTGFIKFIGQPSNDIPVHPVRIQ
jgi:hypothetical protein